MEYAFDIVPRYIIPLTALLMLTRNGWLLVFSEFHVRFACSFIHFSLFRRLFLVYLDSTTLLLPPQTQKRCYLSLESSKKLKFTVVSVLLQLQVAGGSHVGSRGPRASVDWL